ncbi:MAG TPA: PepSY domain-containing protein [Nitrospira sp.]|nr:PepSY domain-containing protein [Nitrospira sp.]
MMRSIGTVALMAVGVLALGTQAWADDKEGRLADMAKEAKVTIDQAVKTAVEKVPGTVVEAELEKKHGKTVWEVEVLGADGAVTEVHIDAADGTVIDTEAKKGDKEKKGHKKGK